ncbi:nitrite reductase large subunit NirB [Granulosicoccaceae sp. 1_MG-2023]|nr:nitrite reductase large subunit NirB [Granulosicoccaceae sp. 1_MG-2023]
MAIQGAQTKAEKVLVIGNGMAGARFVAELHERLGEAVEITVFGAEPHTNYDRIQLSPVLAGEKAIGDIMLNDDAWYRKRNITFYKGVHITDIDLSSSQISDEHGRLYAYDKLVIATGSSPHILPLPGTDLEGVLGYRDIADVEKMIAIAAGHRHAVVIGGGLLGLEAAVGLRKRGMHVTVVHQSDTLMQRQLDATAASMLQAELESRGIEFRLAHQSEAIVGESRVTGLRFSTGEEIPADLIVMAAGIRPNISLGKAAGLVVERALVVDDVMQTSDPAVYALGECVQHRGHCYGLVAPLYEQARVLAGHLAGDPDAVYQGSVLATRLKVTGVNLFSAGDFTGDAGCDFITYRDPEINTYKKLVLRDDKLVGAVLYGDVPDGGWYFSLIQDAASVGDIRDYLIFGEAMCTEVRRAAQARTDKTTTPKTTSKTGHTGESNDMSKKQTLVVIGNGMVGHQFIESFVDKGGLDQYELITFCEEPHMAYDRVHLSEYFSGKTVDELSLVKPGFYASHGIKVYTGEKAVEIDIKDKRVMSSAGHYVEYDKLVLATGSYPFVPPIEGKEHEACLVYRTIEDLDAIRSVAEKGKVGVVVGGGLLGLEAANALKSLGLETHVVEFAPRLMPVQLDEGGGAMLRRKIAALGVTVHTQMNTKLIEAGDEHTLRMNFANGDQLETDLILFSAGIRPQDELARMAGLDVGERGGIVIDNQCVTSDADIYAIGECALWNKQIFGLVAPGYSMARTAADSILGNAAAFTGADMSTKLKLLGVDVGSIGDAHMRTPGALAYTYVDEAAEVYKRIVVSEDGTTLLGAVLVGDNSGYDTLLQYALNGIALPPHPDDLILPQRDGTAPVGLGPDALPESAQICSCFSVTKGAVVSAMDQGCMSLESVKAETCASTGCGGCAALLTSVVDSELGKRGVEINTDLCEHFAHTRQDLYNIVRVEGIRSFRELIGRHGKGLGCDICKPTVASILASVWNDYVLDDNNRALQDTNDFALANMQKDGTYSVVPRIAAGEITPQGLITIGQVADKYKLYTKITGGQRIDMFGARLEELPLIWKELTEAGFESGHAYGKSLRTVKSCVGNSWCRYGEQDSVGMAIRLENRYKGLRSPHKIKFAVSGCTRECAEAQSKDIGVIATPAGWSLYVCGNGGMKPRHGDLFATDLDDATLIRYIDRILMFYIKTADRLQRTSVWMDNIEGGLSYLQKVVIEDSLDLAEELETQMQNVVSTYQDEWKTTIENPQAMKRFRTFVNSDKSDPNVVFVEERGQIRPANEEERKNLNLAV